MTFEIVSCEALELPKPEKTGKAAPSAIHLMPSGAFKARDGRQWTLNHPERVIARFKAAKIDLPIDYEHQSNEAARAKITGPIPAAGWITDLELHPDGLWGQVKWTNAAEKLIREREYRFISPTFAFNTATKEVEKLKGAGLVHTPALHLTALAREEPNMTDNTETALCTIASELGLPNDADAGQIVQKIRSFAGAKPDPAKYMPIEAVRDLMDNHQSEIAAAREKDIEATVSKAIDGGYITPAMKNWATALCRKDPDSFNEFTQNAPPAFAYLFEPVIGNTSVSALKSRSYDETELAICAQLDIEPGTLHEN